MHQNTTPIKSHSIVSNMPAYSPTTSNQTPIRKGEGKSPSKCIKNTDTALACPRRWLGTEVIIEIAVGAIVAKMKNSPMPTPIKKKRKSRGLVTKPEKKTPHAEDVNPMNKAIGMIVQAF